MTLIISLFSCSSTQPVVQKRVQAPSSGPIIELIGEVEGYFAGFMMVPLLHIGKEIYLIEPSQNCEYKLPPEDMPGGMIGWRIGADYQYLVKGHVGKSVSLGPRGNVATLNAIFITRLK